MDYDTVALKQTLNHQNGKFHSNLIELILIYHADCDRFSGNKILKLLYFIIKYLLGRFVSNQSFGIGK